MSEATTKARVAITFYVPARLTSGYGGMRSGLGSR